jgi:hypothetical protein
VICVPRLTVSVDGQMALFWMTSVFGLELGVQPPLGLVLPLDELPPHAIAPATIAATATRRNTRIIAAPRREPLNRRTLEP